MEAIAYLGPEGTFTHQAARALSRPEDSLVPLAKATDVVQGVEKDEYAGGVIAFENSLEGVVSSSLDEILLSTSQSLIAGEHILPVSFCLFRASGDDSPLRGVSSHPFGLAQCSEFIEARELETRETTSTAEACRELSVEPRSGWGAIGPRIAGELYALDLVESELEDEPGPKTRFVLLRRTCPPASGQDRSAFVFRPRQDEPGSLVRLLQEFAARDINLTAIKSRPTHEELGDYFFYIECEGHLTDPLIRSAVVALTQFPGDVRFLGSFPEDPVRPRREVPRPSDDSVYTEMVTKIEA